MAKNIEINIQQSWNELTQSQFEKIVMILHTMEPSVVSYVKVFKILCAAKWWQFRKKAQIRYVLRDVPMSELKELFSFVFKENNRTAFIPVFTAGGKKYFAPMDRIINLTAEEFAVADDLHIRYRETKNKEFLSYLFHVLYSETEERQPFDKNQLDKKINKKIPLSLLLATEITYCGSKNYIAEKFKKAFPKGGKGGGKRAGFGKVIQAMAKGDLSKLEKIEQVNIYKFLTQFQDDIEMIQNQKK